MAQFNEKFTVIKSEIIGENYTGAQDECDNGLGISIEAKAMGENFKGKFADAVGNPEAMAQLLDDFQAYLNHYFG